MSATETASGAVRARSAVLAQLDGLPASMDAGAFHPTGILVGLPALLRRTLGAATYSVPVYVVSGDPLNTIPEVDSLYALADETARALSIDTYRPGNWSGGLNSEPLPSIDMEAVVTLTYLPEEANYATD